MTLQRSIFDLPLITQLVTLSPKLNSVYQTVRPATLNSLNPQKAQRLQSVISYRTSKGLTFLPSKSTTQYVNLIIQDPAILDYCRQIATRPTPNVIFQFAMDGYISNSVDVSHNTVFRISQMPTEIQDRITIISKSHLKDTIKNYTGQFEFTIEEWFNVHLVSLIPVDNKNDANVILATQCFNATKKSGGLFAQNTYDGNLSSFLAGYRLSATITSSTYTAVTLKVETGPLAEFKSKFPNISSLYTTIRSDKAEVRFVIKSMYLDVLTTPPSQEVMGYSNIHSLLYSNVIETLDFSCRRRLTLMLVCEIPFSLVKLEPWIHDYAQISNHFNYVAKGTRTVGIIANKATGKSSMIKHIGTGNVYIDSDLYGQIITYILVGDLTRQQLYSSKNYKDIVADLSKVLTIDDKNVLGFHGSNEYESAFESAASNVIDEQKVDMNVVSASRPLATKWIRDFKIVYDRLVSAFPLNNYLHTITEVIPNLIAVTPKMRYVIFAHTSYELYSILGGCVFAAQFPVDENIGIFLRKRDSPVDIQVFLQRFYESLEVSFFNAVPTVLLADMLRCAE